MGQLTSVLDIQIIRPVCQGIKGASRGGELAAGAGKCHAYRGAKAILRRCRQNAEPLRGKNLGGGT